MHMIVARLRVRPEDREQVLAAAQPLIAATRKEPGCLRYDLHEDVQVPNQFLFCEEWQDRAAIDAHFAMPHFLAFAEVVVPLALEKTITIHVIAESESLD